MEFDQVKKVKTAIVGCGMISNIYINNLMHLFSVIDLVAVCDINRAAAEEKARIYGVGKVLTMEEIAADPEIELVVNLTGPTVHYSVVKTMLEAGKNVYTEKMFTTELEQARELAALAKSRKLYLGVAPDTVLGAGIQTARKLIDCGLIGQVTSGFVSVSRNQNLNSESFRFLQKNGGAIPYDVGIYYIAALVALLGSVSDIAGFGAPSPVHKRELLYQDNPDVWQIPGKNVVAAGLRFANGALVSVHFDGNTVGSERRSIAVYGTEGILELGDPNSFDGFVRLIRPEGSVVEMPFTHGYNGRNTYGEATPFDGYGSRGVGVAELAWALRQGRGNRLSADYGLHCEEVLIAMEQASESGKAYHLQSSCNVAPLKSGYYSTMFDGKARADAERSLVD